MSALAAVDADDRELACGSNGYSIAGLSDASLDDLRLYHVEFAIEDDDQWQHVGGEDHVALLDFEDGTADKSTRANHRP